MRELSVFFKVQRKQKKQLKGWPPNGLIIVLYFLLLLYCKPLDSCIFPNTWALAFKNRQTDKKHKSKCGSNNNNNKTNGWHKNET